MFISEDRAEYVVRISVFSSSAELQAYRRLGILLSNAQCCLTDSPIQAAYPNMHRRIFHLSSLISHFSSLISHLSSFGESKILYYKYEK